MTKCHSVDQIKVNVIDETSDTCEEEEMSARVWWGILKKRTVYR
jgi:hypothetical protein